MMAMLEKLDFSHDMRELARGHELVRRQLPAPAGALEAGRARSMRLPGGHLAEAGGRVQLHLPGAPVSTRARDASTVSATA